MSQAPAAPAPPKSPQLSDDALPLSDDAGLHDPLASTERPPRLTHIIKDVSIGDDSVQFFVGGRGERMISERYRIGERSWGVQVNNMDNEGSINKLADTIERDKQRSMKAQEQATVPSQAPSESASSHWRSAGRTTGSVKGSSASQ